MDRFKAARSASIVGIVGNIFLCIIKMTVGFISKSQAMIADAFNSASDILNSFMTYIGNNIASKEADDDHNLGHGKAEYIYSMLISITMMLLGVSLVKDSIKSLFVNSETNFNIFLIVVCVITIVTKFCLYIYTNNIGKKYNNLLVCANSKDHKNDCFITMGTLISSILSLNGVKYVDGIVGTIIAFWILITGIKIFLESYDVLMDKTIDKDIKDKVFDIIYDHKEVLKVNHFNATPVGYRYQISFTIFVDGNISTFESHEIANHLEKEIDQKIPEIYLTVIHVNPVDLEKDTI